MRIYLREMFPVWTRLATAALMYMSFVLLLGKIHDVKPALLSPYSLLGIWNLFALTLILRLMDELKDREIDLELFRKRPLPAGRVRESDISFSLILICTLYLAANVGVGNAFWAAAALLGYSLLMYRYFFFPRLLRKYLLINLATHNPIVPLMLLAVAVLFSVQCGLDLKRLNWPSLLLLAAMYWAMCLAWEIVRKIRYREEENEYVTYSRIFGRTAAVLITAVIQAFTLGAGIYFYLALSLSDGFLIILILGYAILIWSYMRFLFRLMSVSSKLRGLAELYAVITMLAVIIECTVIPEMYHVFSI